jgi:hypothetical protein
MKNMDRRSFLKTSLITGTSLLYACNTVGFNKEVEPALTGTYPEKLNQILLCLEKFYGRSFIYELNKLPEMQEGYVPEKVRVLTDIYLVGKRLQKEKDTKENIRETFKDILQTGGGSFVSVPLREGYRMLLKGKWSVDDSFNALKAYSENPALSKFCSSGMLDFIMKTDWSSFYDDDWKRFEAQGNDAIVLNKKNLDFLICYHQDERLKYSPDKKDHVQSPEETRKLGGGNSLDFSIEAARDMEVLEKAGRYEDIKVVVIRKKNSNWYAFMTYRKKEDSRIFVMDNAGGKGIRKFYSLAEAGKEIASEHNFRPDYIVSSDWETALKNQGKISY